MFKGFCMCWNGRNHEVQMSMPQRLPKKQPYKDMPRFVLNLFADSFTY